MILIGGERLPSEQSGEALAALPGRLADTLARPPLNPLTVVEALDRFSARLSGGAYAQQLEGLVDSGLITPDQLAQVALQLRRENLLHKLETELGPDFSRETRRTPPPAAGDIRVRRLPLGVLFHIAAGNAEALPAYSVAEGLLAGNINLLKLPHADDGLSLSLLQELTALEPKLAPYLYVFDTPSSDLETMKRLAALADAVVIWGGEEAVKAVRSLAPPAARIIEWGHRLSFAYATPLADPAELQELAAHIIRTNQLFCSSCQGIFYDAETLEAAEGFVARFLPLLEEAGRREEPRDIALQAQRTLRRERRRLEALLSSARVLWGEYGSIRLADDRRLELSGMFGDLWVKPLPREELAGALRPYRGLLQTAGLLCGEEERLPLARLLCRAGVNRVVRGGDMSRLTAGGVHDGRYPLREYSRMVEMEL